MFVDTSSNFENKGEVMSVQSGITRGITPEIVASFVNSLGSMTEYGDVFQDTILRELAVAVKDTKFDWMPNGTLHISRVVKKGGWHCSESAGICETDLAEMTIQEFFKRIMFIAYGAYGNTLFG